VQLTRKKKKKNRILVPSEKIWQGFIYICHYSELEEAI